MSLIKRSYKYRMYPNKTQEELLAKTFGCVRVIAGRRIKRGLFKTSSGNIINADINAAFNIIRKSAKEAFDVSILSEGRGFWWNPVRIPV